MLTAWDRVRSGALENGLKYVIIPNAMPPGKVEVWLEVGVGSAVEQEEERGAPS